MSDWRPNASVVTMRARAEMYKIIREFFVARDVLEVETPLLCKSTNNEPHLRSFKADGESLYLQTSPEFAMKRLLAGGSGAVYQICKAFRVGECGRRHNPEFTLLEWYRPGYQLDQLAGELIELVSLFLGEQPIERRSYRSLFREHLGIDPHRITLDELRRVAKRKTGLEEEAQKDEILDLLLSHVIEPSLGLRSYSLVQDFPASQAALAGVALDEDKVPVAQRFELYWQGMELANGYSELTDSVEFGERFERNHRDRIDRGIETYPLDERFLAALDHLPACCGVALGLDRLLMCMLGESHLAPVLSFTTANA